MTDLTVREREVIEAIKEADPRTLNEEYLSKKLFLSYGRVRNTLSTIYNKTGTRNMAGLILLMLRNEI